MNRDTLIVALNRTQGTFIANQLGMSPREYFIYSHLGSEPIGYHFKVVIFCGQWMEREQWQKMMYRAVAVAEPGAVFIGRGKPE